MPSTVIRSIDYQGGRLEVEFTTGRRYLYDGVPPDVAEAFQAARIKGRHFNARIRGRYRFIEQEPPGEPSPEASPAPPRSGTPEA